MTDPTYDTIRRVLAAAEPMWRDSALDKLARDIAAALAAARAGEAESNPLLAEALRYYAERRTMTNPKGWGHVVRKVGAAYRAGALPATGAQFAEASRVLGVLVEAEEAAQRGGEAVDREALDDTIDRALAIAVTLDTDRVEAIADAVLALLAARVDTAPTVSTEQVERLARDFANDLAWSKRARPWSDDDWAHARRPFIDRTTAQLRAIGIEVRP